LGKREVIQESQYVFPYHYIPSFENGHFCQHLYWPWGFRYIGGIKLVLSILEGINFESLVDIGCGDGRFLREVNKRYRGKVLLGIDYSLRAIHLARAMNPDLNYECMDICKEKSVKQIFDVVTLVEVLEHIPIDLINDFTHNLAGFQKTGGKLIITVPHKNKSVQAKHYQNFDTVTLRKLTETYYEVENIIFFDKISPIFRRLMKGFLHNSIFILNNHFLLDTLFKIYLRHFYICDEVHCGRICFVGKRR